MMLALLVAAVGAATPISLDEVRAQSRGNTQALLAQLDHERAKAQLTVAKSAILPRVSVNGTAGGALYGSQRIFSTVPEIDASGAVTGFTQRTVDVNTTTSRASFDLSVSASQLIYDGGRWWSQIAQAGALEEAQAGQAAEQLLGAELEGVRRFYELLRAELALGVLDANARRSQEVVDRARALFDAGRGQMTDVLGAQVNLGNDQLSVVQQRARIADGRARLAVWLMRPPDAQLSATSPASFEAEPAVAPTATVAMANARTHRPLLRALAATIRAAERGVDTAKSANLPVVSAQATVGRQGPSADPFFTDPFRQNYLQGGLNVRWDVFDGFRTRSEVQQADIARRRVVLELAQAERELEAEVHSSLAQLRAQVEGASLARTNVETARKGLELAQARFAQGLGSTIDVRDAQLKLAQAELTLLQNRIDVEIARAALDRAMGSGATP